VSVRDAEARHAFPEIVQGTKRITAETALELAARRAILRHSHTAHPELGLIT
jgi:hypothetical protein